MPGKNRRKRSRRDAERAARPRNSQPWLRRNISTIVVAAIFVLGLGLLTYPAFADYWNSFHQSRAILSYASEVSDMTPEEYAAIIAEAKEYNRALAETGVKWMLTDEERAEYESLLDYSGRGIMGYIVIDKIKVMLPLYHGTEESILQTSIGHIEGTSLPVGALTYDYDEKRVMDPEDGAHIALSGHRGLPSARLFTDLDKLIDGDTFTLNILNESYTYQVDQIRVVEPNDLSELQIVPGMDYCTLVTCTPYGINTHRLLVRGHRVANPQGDMPVVADALQIETMYVAPFIAVPIVVVLLVLMMIFTRRNRNSGERIIRRYYRRRKMEVE